VKSVGNLLNKVSVGKHVDALLSKVQVLH